MSSTRLSHFENPWYYSHLHNIFVIHPPTISTPQPPPFFRQTHLDTCAAPQADRTFKIPSHNNEAQSCPATLFSSLAAVASQLTSDHGSRASRRDRHLQSTNWLFSISNLTKRITGVLQAPLLPPFKMSSRRSVPGTPRVISPSPTPSDSKDRSQDGYL